MINGRLHREMKYRGKQIIIDACEIENGKIEVMTMYHGGKDSGKEIECQTTDNIDDAEKIWNGMRFKYENQEEVELKGKYKQLRDDLIEAVKAGREADTGEDGGTCNFDAPSIIAPRWNERLVKQAAKEAGISAWKWHTFGVAKFVFSTPTNGQANRRSRVSEAMCAVLQNKGYGVIEYSSLD